VLPGKYRWGTCWFGDVLVGEVLSGRGCPGRAGHAAWVAHRRAADGVRWRGSRGVVADGVVVEGVGPPSARRPSLLNLPMISSSRQPAVPVLVSFARSVATEPTSAAIRV
jgi:hypothetical protein